MCTDAQHNEKIDLLKQLVYGNPPIDGTYQISSTRPYSLDYKERKYIYLWSTNDLTLSLEELGNLPISAGSWVNLSLSAGMRIFAVNQSTLVPIFIRCTDEEIDPGPSIPQNSLTFHVLSQASNNATNVKPTSGNLYGVVISNTNASARFFKLYDLAVAPTPSSSTVKQTYQVSGNSTFAITIPEGMEFLTGISFAAVANISDTDNTSIGSNDLSIDLRYL